MEDMEYEKNIDSLCGGREFQRYILLKSSKHFLQKIIEIQTKYEVIWFLDV